MIPVGRDADSSDRTGQGIALPQLDIRDAVVRVTDSNGRSQTVGPIGFRGTPQGSLVWTFALDVAADMKAQGRVVQGSRWTHRAELDVNDAASLVQMLSGPDLAPVSVKGRWEGRLDDGALVGEIRFDELAMGPARAQGTIRLEAGPKALTLHPQALVLTEPNVLGQPIRIAAGTVGVRGGDVTIQGLAVCVGKLTADLSAHWNLATRIGELSGSWVGTLPATDSVCEGTCHGTVESPALGRKLVELTATAEARTTMGVLSVAAQAQGAGATWQDSRWRLSLPTARWTRGSTQIDMAQAEIVARANWPVIRLVSLHLPNADQVSGSGHFSAASREWSVRIEAQGFEPRGWDQDALDMLLEGRGDARQVTVSECRVVQGPRNLTGRGGVSFTDKTLRDVHLIAQWPAVLSTQAGGSVSEAGGQWRCEADVAGRLQPMTLDIAGTLSGKNVSLGREPVSEVDAAIQAKVDTEGIEVSTEPFTLLGGRWQLNGRHDLAERSTRLSLAVRDLSLNAAADMAGSPLECQGMAQAQLQLAVPGFDIQKTVASGSWKAEKVSIARFKAARANGKLRISDGLVRFDEIEMQNAAGRARGAMQFRLNRPQDLSVDFETDAWPVQFANHPAEFRIDSNADLELDIAARTVDGDGRVSGVVLWDRRHLGRFNASAVLQRRTLDVRDVRADVLDGTISGAVRIPLDRWGNTAGRFQWQDLQPRLLETWWPQASRLEGTVSGSLTADQTAGQPRALEPMRLELQMHVADGRINQARVGDCNAVAYLGPKRLLVERSRFELMGGHIDARTRTSPHANRYYSSVVANVHALDLNQVVHAFDPNAGDMPGRLSGKATLLLSTGTRGVGGEVDLRLTESDLINSKVVQTLYGGLKLGFGQNKPTGVGKVRVQLNGKAVDIASFAYFNRGVDIRGAGRIEDWSRGSGSPVTGYAVGSTRILKDIQLPGVRELDRLMASFQTGVASVEIGGTLAGTEVNVVPLPAVSGAFRRLLWSQLRE